MPAHAQPPLQQNQEQRHSCGPVPFGRLDNTGSESQQLETGPGGVGKCQELARAQFEPQCVSIDLNK